MRTNMTALVLVFALIVSVGAGAILADEGEQHPAKQGDQVTVRGEILDMACFISHGAKGPSHTACAKRCAKAGQPMGLLAKDGTVYLLYAGHQDASAFETAKEYAGTNVEITGTEATQGAFKGIEIHQVKQL
jgi:hypothetical protein